MREIGVRCLGKLAVQGEMWSKAKEGPSGVECGVKWKGESCLWSDAVMGWLGKERKRVF
jgi:hypothetical protein